ncbi:hypothetical protein FRC03_002098 [Tulasnella sp. 419]|nr:hypothetical protein FRC03_002098 [Tulasnella sp. 419]
MSVETQQNLPELKSIERVYNIPLVQDGLSVLHQTLTTYTPTVYAYGQAVGSSAYNLSAPLQVRLAPILLSVDGYANKGLDVVQEKYPTPFTIKTEEITDSIKAKKDNAYNAITTPVYGYANKVDSSLTPILDRLESAITKLNTHHEAEGTDSSSSSEASGPQQDPSQVHRAYRLSLEVKDQIYTISSEQLRQMQNQSVILSSVLPVLITHSRQIRTQAGQAVDQLNASLAASYSTAKDKSKELVETTKSQVNVASQSMHKELEKFQATTKTLPATLQSSLKPVQEGIQGTLTELSGIAKSDISAGEKVSKIASTVQDKIQPLLEQATTVLQNYISEGKSFLAGVKADTNALTKEVEEEVQARASETHANGH